MKIKEVPKTVFCLYCRGKLNSKEEIQKQLHNDCENATVEYHKSDEYKELIRDSVIVHFNENGELKIDLSKQIDFTKPKEEHINDVIENLLLDSNIAGRVKVLNLQDNELSYFPTSILKLTNLRELNLNNNKITALPEDISGLKNLEKLNLSYNELEFLPESIGNLTNLKDLNLYFNYLKELPDSIGNLIKLKRLGLWRNFELKSLPKSLSNLHAEIDVESQVHIPLKLWRVWIHNKFLCGD